MILVGNIFSGIINGVPLSLTTIGDSGPATLDTTTGVLNIPVYAGGGGSVSTDNGISGDGTVGNPVVLGNSNPLIETAQLDVTDFPIEILAPNQSLVFGAGSIAGSFSGTTAVTAWSFTVGDVSLSAQDTAVNALSSVFVNVNEGVSTSVKFGTLIGGTDFVGITQESDIPGLVVSDPAFNIALIGDQNYFAFLEPNQYTQAINTTILLAQSQVQVIPLTDQNLLTFSQGGKPLGFRVTVYAIATAAITVGTSIVITVTYTDPFSGNPQVITLGTLNPATAIFSNTFSFWCDPAVSAISVDATVVGVISAQTMTALELLNWNS